MVISVKAKRIFKKLISYAGLFFFVIAAGMLYWQLSKYSLADIWKSFTDIPLFNLFWACVACFFGYLALSCYDFLALKYVGRKVVWWKWMLAGMLGFAISNNAGHAVVSGGAIRYRLYTRWRIKASEIVKMLTFSGFTYFLGCCSIVVFGYFLVPHNVFGGQELAGVGMGMLFAFCLGALLLYFGLAAFWRKNVHIFGLTFKIPTVWTAIKQTALGATDSILAGMVLYCILRSFMDIDFGTFIGVFVIAQTVGVFSQVPGGLGVFEGMFMLAMPGSGNEVHLFSALIAFRIIYYLLPLIGAGGMFLLYENMLRARIKGWVAEAKKMKESVKEHIHLPHLHHKIDEEK